MTVEMVMKITLIFFTKCALYAVSRTSLLKSISNILIQNDLQHLSPTELTQLYLYGHSNLTTRVNRLLLQSSIKYIHDTERFNKT